MVNTITSAEAYEGLPQTGEEFVATKQFSTSPRNTVHPTSGRDSSGEINTWFARPGDTFTVHTVDHAQKTVCLKLKGGKGSDAISDPIPLATFLDHFRSANPETTAATPNPTTVDSAMSAVRRDVAETGGWAGGH